MHLFSTLRPFAILTGIVALSCASEAIAHQPFESSARARFDGEAMELSLTTSFEIAGRLVGQPTNDPAALEKLRPQLLAAGADLYEVTVGGQPVRPERVFFKLKDEEAVFSMIYLQAKPAPVHFRAAYFDTLPIGYSGSLEVFDEAGISLGHYPRLKKGKDILFIQSPTAASIPVNTPADTPGTSDSLKNSPVAEAPKHATFGPKGSARFLPWTAGILTVLLTLLILVKTRKSHLCPPR